MTSELFERMVQLYVEHILKSNEDGSGLERKMFMAGYSEAIRDSVLECFIDDYAAFKQECALRLLVHGYSLFGTPLVMLEKGVSA